MEEKESEGSVAGLDTTLKEDGYKENVANISRGILTWEKDLVFTARIRG